MGLLTENRVRQAAQRTVRSLYKSAGTLLAEAASTVRTSFDIFLSHSLKDAEIVQGSRTILEDAGFTVYVDWIVDPVLKRDQVCPATAAWLRERMRQCRSLLYLKSENSDDSKWMPWELGFVDAQNSRVAILPVTKSSDSEFKGNEYLGLYPYIDVYGDTFFVNKPTGGFATLHEWINDPNAIDKR